MYNTLKDTFQTYGKWGRVILASSMSSSKLSKASSDKILLLVASHLPPNSGGGVFRPLSFIRSASNHSWRCLAYSLDYKIENKDAGNYLINKLNNPSDVKRVGLNKLQPSWLLTPRIDGGFNNALNLFNQITSDVAETPKAILTTGPSFNTFLVGYYLSKYYKVPLILDYRDEWTLCPFSWVEKDQMNSYFEKICCEHASKIVFTTESHMSNHKQRFDGISDSKRIVLSNGYDEEDFLDDVAEEVKSRVEVFTLSFIGNMGAHSLPDSFFKDLERILNDQPDLLKRLKLVFAGNKSEKAQNLIANFKYNSIINSIDHVAKNEAVKLMHESDALLILAGAGMGDYIPGKLFDYLAINKAVLYYGELGETTRIIDSLGVGFSVNPSDEIALKDSLYKLSDGIDMNKEMVSKWLAKRSRSYLAGQLYSELERTVVQ